MGAVENLWEIILEEFLPCGRSLALADDLLKLCALAPLANCSWRQLVGESVTASDASETGAGLCVPIVLTAPGRSHLEEAAELRKNPPADSLFLFVTFN